MPLFTNNRRAFTIIEIMSVVAIIGILVVIAVPATIRARDKARVEQARADLEILRVAILQLAWDTGMWPAGIDRSWYGEGTDDEVFDLTTPDAGLLSSNAALAEWKGPYLDDVPLDPWGNRYFFDHDYQTVEPAPNDWLPVVGSFGPDGIGPNVYNEDNIYIILGRPE